ncbi:hypothetical protein CYY_002197 [Polysphondylium violaceum]|uniref:alpha-mannosidase n=1 Tax=Polysphondylium violaceum TaxID=133409 RepID=A0A8J4Q0J2_9MYCE|nr:hypothetical protein CYY_002197 [Polysphondylium violaceum]
MVMQKHQSITIERIEKFLSDTYFVDANIYGRIYPELSKESVSLQVSDVCDRISYQDAQKLKFKSSKVGDVFGPSWTTFWFKVHVEVPESWKNKIVHFLWNSSSEALIWINGVPIQGLTGGTWVDKRIEYKLLDNSNGGEVFDFEIEMACNGMFGVGKDGLINPCDPNKTFTLTRAEIGVFDKEAYELYTYMSMLYDISKNFKDESLRKVQAIWVANDIINKCNVSDPTSYPKCIQLAKQFFDQKNGDSMTTVSSIGHCHIDLAWLWPYAETKRKCARSFSTQILYMDQYKEYKFTQSQAQAYKWTKELYPELYEKIKVKAAQGQFIPTGGTWVEMDGNLPSAESFIRQFLLGQSFFKKEFGSYCNVFWLPDTFGYSGQLPQIIRHAGIEYFMTQKLSWNNINKFPHSTFIWEGLDGSSVLTHFPPANTYNSAADVKEIVMSSTNNKDIDRSNHSLLVYGHGDGGGGPNIEMIERLTRLSDTDGIPKVEFNGPEEFFKKLEPDRQNLLKWIGELYFELHRGTYTAQSQTKRGNRKCEFELHASELLSSYCDLLVKDYKSPDFNPLWELVLLNQFHDVLPGSSIGMVYKDSLAHHQQVISDATSLTESSMKQIVGSIISTDNSSINSKQEEKSDFMLVYNPIDFQATRVIEIPRGSNQSIPDQYQSALQTSYNGVPLGTVTVPPNGFSVVDISSKESKINQVPQIPVSAEQLADGSIVVKNAFVEFTVSPTGGICSLVELQSGRQVIPAGEFGNKFVLFEDISLFWQAWDVEIYSQEKPVSQLVGSCKLLEKGPLRSVIQCHFAQGFPSGTSSLNQSIILYHNSARIDFETQVNWNENNKLLRVQFPTNIRSQVATYEIQAGHLERPTHTNTSWDMAKFEVCGHKWADLSEHDFGLSLLNDCKYGYAIQGGCLQLSLLRAPKAPDDNCDIGHHTFTYSIFAHTGSLQSSGVINQGYHLNTKFYQSDPFVLAKSSHIETSLISTNKASVVIETLKKAEDGNGHIVRVYESFGGHISFEFNTGILPIPFKTITPCNGLEIEQSQPIPWNTKINLSPFQIKSFRLL